MIRKEALARGWYPHDKEEIKNIIEEGRNISGDADERTAPACIAPHAGWFFSGALAARALLSLRADAGTVVVCGGHLPPSAPALFAEEDAVETPLGNIEIDAELRGAVQRAFERSGIKHAADSKPDNTVEVLLPAVRFLFPEAKLLWLRLPAALSSMEAGKIIAREAAALGRNAVCAGSTDLTHYGDNYDFMPHGAGDEALRWVKEVNDRRFIDALLEGDGETALKRATFERSACSPGAALCALGFAQAERPAKASLLAASTSADILRLTGDRGPYDSFVGYAALRVTSGSV